jgi:hypothetical protein
LANLGGGLFEVNLVEKVTGGHGVGKKVAKLVQLEFWCSRDSAPGVFPRRNPNCNRISIAGESFNDKSTSERRWQENTTVDPKKRASKLFVHFLASAQPIWS